MEDLWQDLLGRFQFQSLVADRLGVDLSSLLLPGQSHENTSNPIIIGGCRNMIASRA